MHVIVSRPALLEVLGAASSVAATRSTKDVLKCVRLTTKDSGLIVSATDLEVALRVEVQQVEIKRKGDMLIPADKLMSIVRESTDDTLTLEAEEQVCHIRGKDSHFEKDVTFSQKHSQSLPWPLMAGHQETTPTFSRHWIYFGKRLSFYRNRVLSRQRRIQKSDQ